jgi:hypothetical protein
MFARHVAYVNITLLVDVGQVEAGSVEGVEKFLSGLGRKRFDVEPDGDCIGVVRVLGLRLEFKWMPGGEGCEQGLGWRAEV